MKKQSNRHKKSQSAKRMAQAAKSTGRGPSRTTTPSKLFGNAIAQAGCKFPLPPTPAISEATFPLLAMSKARRDDQRAEITAAQQSDANAPAAAVAAAPRVHERPGSLTSRLAELHAQSAVPTDARAHAVDLEEADQPAKISAPVEAQPVETVPQQTSAVAPPPVVQDRKSASSSGRAQRARPADTSSARPMPGDARQHAPSASAPSGPDAQRTAEPERSADERETDERAAGDTDDGASKPLVRRASNREQREVMLQGMATAKRHLVTVAIFSIAVNLLVLVLPVYLFQVSDRVLTSRSTDTLVMLSVVVIGAIALQALLDVFRRLLLMRVAVQVETSLGAAVLAAATKGAQQGSTRDFQALLDLQQLRNFITGPTLLQIFDAPIAPVYFLAVFLVHPHLGMILIAASLILIAIAMINRRITAVPFAQASGYTARASQHVEAMARNAQVINAMGMIREGTILWGRETAESLKSQISAQDRNVYLTGITKFARLATQVAMLGWGAHLVLNNELTGGMMIAASIVASRALSPVEGLIEGWRSVVQARTGYARVTALLNATPLNQERLQLPRPQGRLHVDRVLFVPQPSKKVILNGIDFTLDPGESMAIVGPSGTGKSTLARMLIGSLTPTSGSVRLDLMDIRNWDPRQFGETIGYLAQDVELLPATVKANIARLREDVTDEEIFNAAELAGVHEMIASLPQGYETMIGLDGSPLSGGQKQRIGLARAFFGRPRLVVLDEPNSNLDNAGEAALARALLQAKRHGITVVAVTQRPALLKSVDKIMLLAEGKVQALGPRDEILQRLSGQKRALVESAA